LYQRPGRGIPLNVSGPAQPAGVMAKRGLPQLLGLAVLLFEAVSPPAGLGDDSAPTAAPVRGALRDDDLLAAGRRS
jgi:hypothetical protein